jgi:hypothetical protein
MRGKLVEDTLSKALINAYQSTSAETLYNGVSSTTGKGLDCDDYDQLVVQLSNGANTSGIVVTAALYHNTTDDPSTAVAVTGASFTNLTSANKSAIQVGSVFTKGLSRYMWLMTWASGTGTYQVSAIALLGKGRFCPSSQTPVFDLETW